MTRRPLTRGVAALCLLAGLAACGDEPAPTPAASPTTSDLDLPPGVRLTPPGEKLEVGQTGTTVLDLGDGARSAVTVAVQRVREGDLDDFGSFTLDEADADAMPLYVDVGVRNEGPADLGGSSLPVLVRTDTDALLPPTELVGDFEPCPVASLPAQFLAGSSARLCFVYLVPEGQRARSVELVPRDEDDTLRWVSEGAESSDDASEDAP